MGLFKRLKDTFKQEYNKKFSELKNKPEEKEDENKENSNEPLCHYCKMRIHGEQKIKTFNGEKYHLKPCWYNLRKDAQKQLYGN